MLIALFIARSNFIDPTQQELPVFISDEEDVSYTQQTKLDDVIEGKTISPTSLLNPITLPKKIKIGVHANTSAVLTNFERNIGRKVDIVAAHVHWGNENKFPIDFGTEVLKGGATLMIFWNPMDYRKPTNEQKPFHYSHILEGGWDNYIDEFAQASLAFGGDIIIAPMEEVNGEWTPWSGKEGRYGSIDEYIDSFRYLHDKFNDVPNVDFAWVINHDSVPKAETNSISTYYPGDNYVDLIGINAFNFDDPWTSFDALVQESIEEVRKFDKPVYITSVASAEGPRKAEWINNFFVSRFFSEGFLRGFIWFNEDKERDWTIESDKDSLKAFKKGVSNIDP